MASAQDIPSKFEDALADLRPVIRRRSFFEELQIQSDLDGSGVVPIPFMPVGDHLVACLVYVRDSTRLFVHRLLLDQWGARFRDALMEARGNLSHEVDGVDFDGRVFSPDAGDTFDASRILWKRPIQRLKIVGDPVAMAVNDNRLFIAGSRDKKGLGILAKHVEDCLIEPDLLCTIPLRLVEDRWQSWMPPADHPHYETFKSLARRYYNEVYTDQHDRLTDLYETRGLDIYVAGFMLLRNSKTAEEMSCCIWTEGGTSLLPKVDRVHFFMGERKPILTAHWGNVVSTVGHLMKRQPERYPPRWLVREFPTTEEFREMGAQRL